MRFASCLVWGLCCGLGLVAPARAAITIKDRAINEPLVLDQNDDYLLQKVYISGITDLAALTLAGKINSVTLHQCTFSNIWAGMNGKAVGAESQGALVGTFTATESLFEDAQHQLVCMKEGAFGTVSFQRCKFRTTDNFLKRIYADDPWRTTPPTTEFANIDRLELIDNEYSNTILVIHPSVKLVIFRGDLSSIRLESPNTHVIRLDKSQDPSMVGPDGVLVRSQPDTIGDPAPAEKTEPAALTPDVAEENHAVAALQSSLGMMRAHSAPKPAGKICGTYPLAGTSIVP